MRSSTIVLLAFCLLGLFGCEAADGQISMTPRPRGETPGAIQTAAKPTPADTPTPPPRH